MLRETWLGLLLALATFHESHGAYDAALAALNRVVSADETHEDAHAGLIRVYSATGRTGQALRQYARFRDVLRREPDIEPSAATQRLHADVAAGRIAADAAPSAPGCEQHADSVPRRRHNLPASLTSVVGRQREMDEVEQIVQTTRLLSLVGTGGAGKLRLELAAARASVLSLPQLAARLDDALGVLSSGSRTVVGSLEAAIVWLRADTNYRLTICGTDEHGVPEDS